MNHCGFNSELLIGLIFGLFLSSWSGCWFNGWLNSISIQSSIFNQLMNFWFISGNESKNELMNEIRLNDWLKSQPINQQQPVKQANSASQINSFCCWRLIQFSFSRQNGNWLKSIQQMKLILLNCLLLPSDPATSHCNKNKSSWRIALSLCTIPDWRVILL